MSSWMRRATWIGAVLVAAAVGHWLAIQVSPRSAAQLADRRPTLPIEAIGTDFGEVLEDSDFAWTVRLRNTGPDDIEVDRVGTSCDDCVRATPNAFHLATGQEVALNLTIDLTRRAPDDTIREGRRSFRKGLRLSCKRGNETAQHQFAVVGVVRDVLQLTAADLDLGEHSILSQPLTPFRMDLKSAGPYLRVVHATATPASGWDAHAVGEGKGRWHILFTPRKALSVGAFQIPLSVQVETSEGAVRRRLDITGRMVEDLHSRPRMLAFAPARIGEVVSDEVLVWSRTGRPIRVQSVRLGDPDATAESKAGGNNEWTIRVAQKVTKAGKHFGFLDIMVVDADGRQTEHRHEYWYYGLGGE